MPLPPFIVNLFTMRFVSIAFFESLRFAYQNVRANLLRTLLSLLGITVGIFCIISIFTFVDSTERTIKDSFNRLGSSVLYVQKWPWGFSSDYPWWKYVNRPQTTYEEMLLLKDRMKTADAVGFIFWIPEQKLENAMESVSSIEVKAFSHNYNQISEVAIQYGRYFTEAESKQGSPVCIIGHTLATNLFGNPEFAVGKKVTGFKEQKITVVGVMEKEGNALGVFGQQDNSCNYPIEYIRKYGDYQEATNRPSIYIKGKEGISLDEVEDETMSYMRGIRRLYPSEDDDFAVNQLSLIKNVTENLFSQISFIGIIIAGFSILVGGFGVANIMYVSVKERTAIIGVQKSLGSKSIYILIQFLAESVILSLLGGVAALILIALGVLLVNNLVEFQLYLTTKNVLIGITVAGVIGIVSGILPARSAAKLNPVESIRQGV